MEETNSEVWILFLGIVSLIYYYYLVRREQYLYRFKIIKDKLIQYAIDGVIDKHSITFNNFLLTLNLTLAFGKKMKMKGFVESLEKKNVDFDDTKLKDDFEKQDLVVHKLFNEFTKDFIGLLVYNNLLLLVIVKLYLFLYDRKHYFKIAGDIYDHILPKSTKIQFREIKSIYYFNKINLC